MSFKENTVYKLAASFCKGGISPELPEGILYGYAKLLQMDERVVEKLLSFHDLKELNDIRGEFRRTWVDFYKVCTEFPQLIPLLYVSPEEQKKYDAYYQKVEELEPQQYPGLLIEAALNASALPIADVFSRVADPRKMAELHDKLEERKESGEYAPVVCPDRKVTGEEGSKYVTELARESGTKDDPTAGKKASGRSWTDSEDERDGERGKNESRRPGYWDPESYRSRKIDLGMDPPRRNRKAGVKKEPQSVDALGRLSENDRMLTLALLDVVKGQEQAVMRFVKGCFQSALFNKQTRTDRPQVYFFFFGPPGVGKTLLARTAAETMKRPWQLFDMSEYSSKESNLDLIGVSDFYKSARPGILTEYVKKHPDSVLIFDEIEKAHINVMRLFLQILGQGRLRDICLKEEVSFANTIIIFTSNVGKAIYADRNVKLGSLPENVILDAIKSEKNVDGEMLIPPEICSRIAAGNLILFEHLSVRNLYNLAEQSFHDFCRNMAVLHRCNVTFVRELPLLFLYHYGSDIDARITAEQSGNFLKNEMHELIRQMGMRSDFPRPINAIHFEIEMENVEPEIKQLFESDGRVNFLLMAGEDTAERLPQDKDGYRITRVSDSESAREELKRDYAAVLIDPRYGQKRDSGKILSLTDYDTDGIRFFNGLMDAETGIPVYILDTEGNFTDIDRQGFAQVGAADTLSCAKEDEALLGRRLSELAADLYMQSENLRFTQRGFVLDFRSRQEIERETGSVRIVFYDLRKRMAVDVASRGSLLSQAERPEVRFADVIGAESAKKELRYFVEYLKNPKYFLSKGEKPPKGILLYGPPGTGKTMLAKAMAGESDVTFLQTTAAEFLNSSVGKGEEKMREAFRRAQKYAPAIIFIDEIDTIGKRRTGTGMTESMLNTLLTQMDGFATDRRKPVFVLAATNYGISGEGAAVLDEALLRRFDNKIYISLPNLKERRQYLEQLFGVGAAGSRISESILDNIAERTTGQSLAELQNVAGLAMRSAVRDGVELSDEVLLTALEEYIHGEKKEHTAEYYYSVAIHEAGHAYVAWLSGDKPAYLTVESRGDFGGYMMAGTPDDTPAYTEEMLIGKIRTALAGRVAEEVFFGAEKGANTGAASDLEKATNLAFGMLCRYGLTGDRLVSLNKEEVMHSSLAGEYLEKANEILQREMQNTQQIIKDGRGTIERIAKELVEKNRLTGQEFETIMKQGKSRRAQVNKGKQRAL